MVHAMSPDNYDDFAREYIAMELDLLPGEYRGVKIWSPLQLLVYTSHSIWEINNVRVNVLFYTGAEISILHIAFFPKIGCQI